ncbi:LysR family transcriptional regulator [Alcaligenes endophyticus]|uniref:LysR family transcriptional regulator n=2 Tax=Alcaligenes endophyticus TaxID=1929088 RepID=A0ABT8EHT4_9BURK|nr:LysR family transcriptional regulator [Alcaligenes endophyticus]MCX5592192.1 LysR family transcriptional regulator [Alcaligenes endophyticus]MDN4120839.1 LysR family transcriptional regulator [Alcaligenes endophyticus]
MDWDNLRYFMEVARYQRISAAALRLGVQHSTVARRIQALEQTLGLLLFNKSTVSGYTLTAEGLGLFERLEPIESSLHATQEAMSAQAQQISGHLRLACTEGFGTYVLTPLLTQFQSAHPDITLDLLTMPRHISLPRREADIAIALERPERGPYWCTRLCHYELGIYAHRDYLETQGTIDTLDQLEGLPFIAYVDDLLFSESLKYLGEWIRPQDIRLRCTSLITQYHAVLQAKGLAILPYFLARTDPRLQPVLATQVKLTRSFWMYCHEELRHTTRALLLWDFLKTQVQAQHSLLHSQP